MKLNLLKLTYAKIGVAADDFLAKFHSSFSLPIPIEELAEGKLGIEIIPVKGLREKHDVDGSLDSTLSRIFIDLDLYMDNENRTRFTLAHEIGHLVMHKQIFQTLKINNPDDVYNLTKQISDEDYGWLEYQAYTFAGHVLVPKDSLIKEVEERLGKIPERKFLPEQIFPISQELLEVFKISGEVLSRRLGKAGVITTDGQP